MWCKDGLLFGCCQDVEQPFVPLATLTGTSIHSVFPLRSLIEHAHPPGLTCLHLGIDAHHQPLVCSQDNLTTTL
jgi:hypothetical protein